MKKNLLLIVMFLIALPLSVQAQEWLQFDELLIEIWPEYDQPSVLIIYRGVLSPNITLPAEVTFQIPAIVGQPHAVAFLDEQGQLMSVQFQRVVRGELAEISFLTPSREIQFEYYDPTLERSGVNRTYQFQWTDNHLINAAAVQVQQPRGASEFSISPSFATTFQGNDGLMYYYDELINLESDSFSLQIAYQNQSDSLSAAGTAVQPIEPIDPDITFSLQGRDIIPWIVGGIGLLAFFSAVIIYWSSQRGVNPLDLTKALNLVEGDEKKNQFCSKCGSETGENDRFCRVCGTRLV